MDSTMADGALTVGSILRHAAAVYGASVVATSTGEGVRTTTYAEVAERARRLAAALATLGVGRDDRVATFAWNNQEHVEAYFAVPGMGAVLHTLNIRLSAEQVGYIANHAADKVVIVDASLLPLLAPMLPAMTTVEHLVVVGAADTGMLAGARVAVHDYDTLLAGAQPGLVWPELDELDAAAMCYTSGTTGAPKGVVYSHRSTWLHAAAVCTANGLGVGESDRVLAIVPMFHANAWGLVHAALMSGADLVLPDRNLQAEPLTRLIAAERVSAAGAVPTIWNDVRRYAEAHPVELSSLRLVVCGGSAVPLSLMQGFEREHGVRIVQAWGMTETSPLGAVAHPPKGCTGEEQWRYRDTAGRLVCGVEGRVTGDDGAVLPNDGASVGEIEVRGPWVTAAYYRDDDPARFHDGWLRTGDVGHLDERGFLTLTDRAKDIVKSGGEWISSVALENALMAHPDVVEAAVVGVPDERWGERPLACVVPRKGTEVDAAALRAFLATLFPSWQLPDHWAAVEAVPRTSVGKFDKKVLRARYAAGELAVIAYTA